MNMYSVLGLIPFSDAPLIKEAYVVRSLLATGEELESINMAYKTLSNAKLKLSYDEILTNKDIEFKDFYVTQNFTEELKLFERDWLLAIEHKSFLIEIARDLHSISEVLEYTFKLLILKSKDFNEAKEISENLNHVFLSSMFGNDEDVLKLAETLFRLKRYKEIEYVYNSVRVIGEQLKVTSLETNLIKKYPDLKFDLLDFELVRLFSIKNSSYEVKRRLLQSYMNRHNFKMVIKLFFRFSHIEKDGKRMEISSELEFIRFVVFECCERLGLNKPTEIYDLKYG